jgi:hypothetical protein
LVDLRYVLSWWRRRQARVKMGGAADPSEEEAENKDSSTSSKETEVSVESEKRVESETEKGHRESRRESERKSITIQDRANEDPTCRTSPSRRESEMRKLRFQRDAESHKVPLKKMINFGTLLQGCGTAVLACFMTLAQSSLSYSRCGCLLQSF